MSSTSTLGLFVRLIVSLGVVITLMVIAARALRGRGVAVPSKSSAPGADVEVLARKGLSRGTSIAVVRAGGRELVVGVTDNEINLLAEADPASLVEPGDPAKSVSTHEGTQWTRPSGGTTPPGPSWKGTLNAMREKTVRKR